MLTWAFRDGTREIVNARDAWSVSHAQRQGTEAPKDIAPAECPACAWQLVPVRSPRGVHFFRHSPQEEPCYVSAPEGQDHLEAKRRLIDELRRLALSSGTLHLAVPCGECSGTFTVSCTMNQNDVIREEHWLNPDRTRKPDVAVLRDGGFVFLFEIVATHPCGDDKWTELEGHGVPVAELFATTILGQENQPPWSAEQPLGVDRALVPNRASLCDACLARRESERLQREGELARQVRIEEQNERLRIAHPEAKREFVRHVWFIDFHYPNGTLVRGRAVAFETEHFHKWEGHLADRRGNILQTWPTGLQREADDFVVAALNCAKVRADSYSKAALVTWPPLLFKPSSPVPSVKLALSISSPLPVGWWLPHENRWIEARPVSLVQKHLIPKAYQQLFRQWLLSDLIPVKQASTSAGDKLMIPVIPMEVLVPFLDTVRRTVFGTPLKNILPKLAEIIGRIHQHQQDNSWLSSEERRRRAERRERARRPLAFHAY